MPGTMQYKRGGGCERCGNAAHEHRKERVQHENGTYSYDYYCDD